MHHTTTLVVDFDDTLAITHNRDWGHAEANTALINKLNSLYDQGWAIHIVTARGQLSCKGDCEAADKKYRSQIESWLSYNGVKYTDLSFQKKLAAYYIDDKGITPENFLNNFSRVELKGGMSGASVYYDAASNDVIKTASNTASVVAWYEFAKLHYNVPKIYSVIGDTIKMQKLEPYTGPFERILEVCYDFHRLSPLYVGLLPHRYVDRCVHRILAELSGGELDFNFISKIIEYASMNSPLTFGHGDFSISNIMSDPSGQSVYLIDPINDPTLLSSWVIDLAKLYMSIDIEHGPNDPRLKQIELFAAEWQRGINLDILYCHVIGHLCRVFPYATEEKKKHILSKIKWRINQVKDRLSQRQNETGIDLKSVTK